MNRRRAVILVAVALVTQGVGWSLRYGMHHDPDCYEWFGLWALLLAPLIGGITGIACTSRPRHKLRTCGHALVGCACGALLALATSYVVGINASCVNRNGSDECGFGTVVEFLGDAAVVVLLGALGATMLVLGRRNRSPGE